MVIRSRKVNYPRLDRFLIFRFLDRQTAFGLQDFSKQALAVGGHMHDDQNRQGERLAQLRQDMGERLQRACGSSSGWRSS